MPAAIQQVLSQEMFCEFCLQKTREIRRKSMESMFSAHREECNSYVCFIRAEGKPSALCCGGRHEEKSI